MLHVIFVSPIITDPPAKVNAAKTFSLSVPVPPWCGVNASRPNLCDQLLKSGQANTPGSAVAKRLASCSVPLSHALPGLIGFICIMYMGRVHYIIMRVIDKRRKEWI